jgi:hypothetical protein
MALNAVGERRITIVGHLTHMGKSVVLESMNRKRLVETCGIG